MSRGDAGAAIASDDEDADGDADGGGAEQAALTRTMLECVDAAGVHGLGEGALYAQCCVATDTRTPSARQHLCTVFARCLHRLLRAARVVCVGIDHVALVAMHHVPRDRTRGATVAEEGSGGAHTLSTSVAAPGAVGLSRANNCANGAVAVPRTWLNSFGSTNQPALQLFREMIVRLVHDHPGIPERLVVRCLLPCIETIIVARTWPTCERIVVCQTMVIQRLQTGRTA